MCSGFMNIIIPIVGFFLLGFICRRFITGPAYLVRWINYFIIYISLPAIILLKVPQLNISPQVIIPAAVAWTWVFVGGFIIIVISRWLKWAKTTEGAMLLLVTMGNSSFLGYPMVLAFFGDAVLAYAIFFDQLGSFLILSTYGFIVLAIYSPSNGINSIEQSSLQTKSTNISFAGILKTVFSFPPFMALIVALFLPIDGVVNVIQPGLELTSILLMPAALFVLGVQFQPKLLPEHRAPLMVGIVLKMLIAPLLALTIVSLLNASPDVRNATVFESSMPSMVTPGLMAIAAGIAPRFVATMLGYCTLIGFITLPIIAFYLNSI